MHLIEGPQRNPKPGRRGAVWNWPEKTVEDAAAVWVIRELKPDEFWTPPSTITLKRIKFEANNIYQKYRSDPESYKCFFRKQFDPEGNVGAYLISYDLNPFVVSWIATVEKVRRKKSIFEPAKVVFNWKYHLGYENGNESLKLEFEDVTLEPSDYDTVTMRVSNSQEVDAKLIAIMRSDPEKYYAKRLSAEEWDEIERNAAEQEAKRRSERSVR